MGERMLRDDRSIADSSLAGELDADLAGSALLSFWPRIKDKLRAELGEAVYTSWFGRLEAVGLNGSVAEFSLPTKFLKTWVQSHYAARILAHLRADMPHIERITFAVRPAGGASQRPAFRIDAPKPRLAQPDLRQASSASLAELAPQPLPRSAVDGFDGSPLDRRMTFDNFLQARANALAFAAAQQVSKSSASDVPIYNPLYVHSAVGLGKTHLVQATAQSVEASGRRVIYLTAERFMYSFVSALKAQTAIAFKEKLRAIDLLVIDDVQFLHGKSIQQEFCHTLNALLDAGRQVIIAGDRPPSDLEALEERVRSRLAGGLVVEIGALEEELRIRILETRIQIARQSFPEFTVPQPVVAHIAKLIASNGRDLEGAVNRLLAHATLTGQPFTLESAENAVRDLIRTHEQKKVKIEDIQRLVANHYNVSRQDILSSRRTATVVRPRQIAMYLSKALTPRSYPEIGRRFGGRDHTTVLHAVRKIEELATKDTVLANEIDLLKRMLQE
jgi:chromosomal replication initiator protein